MKTISKKLIISSLMGILIFGTIASAKNSENLLGTGILDPDCFDTNLTNMLIIPALPGDIAFSMSELDILLHMKEEEKLARDVYMALNDKWKMPIFSNIARAENTHMNAVINLLKSYGKDYSVTGEPGKFSDKYFQDLYDKLVEKGSESPAEAFKTGALIEELDIRDIDGFLKEVTNENIKLVFENLQRGSRNHLRAFNRQLVRSGISYTPVYITAAEFNQFIDSPHETGNGNQACMQDRKR